MIVPSMNFDEIRNEIKKEMPILFRKATYVAKDIGKTLKLQKDEEVHKYFDYYSKYKNKWIYCIRFTKKRDYFVFLHYNYDSLGLNAMAIMGDLDDYMFLFTAHFFKRYNERRKLNLTLTNDILRAFMEDNTSFQVQRMEDIGINMEKIFCTTNSGVLLGTVDTSVKLYRMNTFLTPEMLKQNQAELAEQLKTEFPIDKDSYYSVNF